MRKSVLFVTPCVPSFTGNGLAMRGAANLKLLSLWADVHVLNVPFYLIGDDRPGADIQGLYKSWHRVPVEEADGSVPQFFKAAGVEHNIPRELLDCSDSWREKVWQTVEQIAPDLIVAFRFHTGVLLLNKKARHIPIWLELDELDSNSRVRLAHLARMAKAKQLDFLLGSAQTCEKLEKLFLPEFERIFVSSHREASNVLERCPSADVRVIPNIFPHVSPLEPKISNGVKRFLCVGNFTYPPNRDALNFFSNEVLPVMRQHTNTPIEVLFVGGGIQPGRHARSPEIMLIGAVPNTTPYYAGCDAAIVPLRSGGGTRIKILEAFSHGRPVISTSLGAEGLAVEDNVHLQIADDPAEFAERCLSIVSNVEERDAMTRRAHSFFVKNHSMNTLEELLPSLFE